MNNRPVLILGGGFIGQALANRLASQGGGAILLSRSTPCTATPGVKWRQGSIDDPSLLAELLPLCQAVAYTATTTTPGSFPELPSREAEENLLPLLNLLEALYEHPHLPLLYLSSGGAIYGNPNQLPVSEKAPPAPLSYHAAGKAAAEQFLGVFAHQGHTVTVLRPSNAYGPSQPGKPGFGVIRTLLEHIRNRTTLEIWGDGEAVRDYLYIDDLIQACILALAEPCSGIFNIGSGHGYSINSLCQLAATITGQPMNLCYLPARGVDVKEIILDSTAFGQRYNWQAEVTLEQGLRATWNSLQSTP